MYVKGLVSGILGALVLMSSYFCVIKLIQVRSIIVKLFFKKLVNVFNYSKK